jgi:NAD(P)-dependent dehydrogenase (short-subunit alcohol dehydrogenase family)
MNLKTALVTGSAKGIGRGIALELARNGYDIAIHYRNSREQAETFKLELQTLGVNALVLQADVTQALEAEQLVQDAATGLGGLGVLVNNVGDYIRKPLSDLELEDWHAMMDTNLNATFYTCRAAIPLMRNQHFGRIINIGFAGAQNLVSRATITPYAIAKTGVLLLTKAIAKSEAEHGITANVVAPGVIENSISQPLEQIPMKRLGTTLEVAQAVLFYLQETSNYITGQTLEVAGAWNL